MRRSLNNQKFVVAAIYVSALVLNSLDATIVNVSLSTLGRSFHVPASDVEMVVIGYLVSLAVFMPTSGWLGDRFGIKRTFLAALLGYTLSNVICGFATTLDQLVLFRIFQGVGGGLLVPVGMTLLYRTFPPAERVAISRVLMFPMVLGPALGPVIGGAILEVADWRWTFWVKVPFAALAFLFGVRYLADERVAHDSGRFDWRGFLLAGVGLGATIYALLKGPDLGWTSPRILGLGLLGVTSLVTMVRVEMGSAIPLVNLRLYTNRLFRTTSVVTFFGIAGFLGTLFIVPLFLQEARGLSPFHAGLATMPEAIGVVCSTQLVSRVYPRIGPRRLQSFGLGIVGVGILILSGASESTPVWLFQLQMFFIGAGMAFMFIPNQAASMATIPRDRLSGASMLFSVTRQIGSATGVAIVSTVLSLIGIVSTSNGVEAPNVDAYRAAFYAAAALAFTGSALALLVPDSDAAETMTRGRAS